MIQNMNGKQQFLPDSHESRSVSSVDHRQTSKTKNRMLRHEGKVRSLQPTGVIYLGGTGANIGSMRDAISSKLENCDEFVRSLVIDTDPASQSGSPKGVSFSDREFLHVNPSRVRAVTENIKRHHSLSKLIGLDDPNSLAFHQTLVTENTAHAGQVRPYGCLATHSDWLAIKVACKRLIADLVGDLSSLEQQLASENRILIRKNISIHLVCSVAGGTGSSMALPVAAIIRELTKEIPCEIIATLIMPSAFDSVLEGKADQSTRVLANAYATLLEFEAARTGLLGREGIRLGVPVEDQCVVVPGLFNHMFLVGRYQANGKDLKTLEAVYDSVALFLAGIMRTEIADRVAADDANEVSLKRLSPDPVTKQPRHVSSLGAKAISINVDRISKNFAARQVAEMLQAAIGTAELKDSESRSDAFLTNPLGNNTISLDIQSFSSKVFQLCPAQPEAAVSRGVFRASRGDKRLYHANRHFVEKVGKVKSQFEQTQVVTNESKIAEVVGALVKQIKVSLTTMLANQSEALGYRSVVQTCKLLAKHLESRIASVQAQSESDLIAAKKKAEQLAEQLVPMGSLSLKFWTSNARQDKIAALLQAALASALMSQIKSGLHRLLISLRQTTAEILVDYERLLVGSTSLLDKVDGIVQATAGGKSLTTASFAELDLSNEEIDSQLYQEARLTTSELTSNLAKVFQCKDNSIVGLLAGDTKLVEVAVASMQEHFAEFLSGVSVVDVLAALLNDPRTHAGTMARLQHLLQGCQPLWTAESGQLGLEFSDSLMIGLPASGSRDNYQTVREAIEALGPQSARANGQYSGTVTFVDTGDLTRVYAIRRVSGACYHYLSEVRRAKLAYDQWNRMGGHSVHIFNSGIVAKMPSLIPTESVDEGELAFSLGVAFGWIASRGAYWYQNLTHEERGNFVCRLSSQWNCIAFRDQAFDPSSSSLSALVQVGRISYESRNDPEPSERLGQGMDEAFESVTNNGEIIEGIMKAFDALRTAAGDIRVVEDLERYCGELRKRTRASDTNYALVCQMVERLSYLANRLRSDNATSS